MKKLLGFLFFTFGFLFSTNSIAQTSEIDSLKRQLNLVHSDSSQFNILKELASGYTERNQDSFLFYTKQELLLVNRLNNIKKAATVYSDMGQYYYTSGDYPLALQMLFKSLQLSEGTNDTASIAVALHGIGNTYKEYDEPEKAKQYYLLDKRISEIRNDKEGKIFCYTNLGYIYTILNKLDSALFYEQQAYELSLLTNSYLTGYTHWYLAGIQSKLNNKTLAFVYYRLALDTLKKYLGPSRLVSKLYLDYAEFYEKYGNRDSALYFAHTSMDIAAKVPYVKGISKSARFLSTLYDSLHQNDSAYYYQKIYVAINDSLNSRNRTSNAENQTFLEQIRQVEKEQAQIKAQEQQKENIQYALIALGLVVAITLFLLLSRSVIANERVIKLLGVLALLIVFEFLNLLLHPFLERITNNAPLLMLVALVAVAAILVPLHHRIESWATTRLIEKNKQIRLAAAKKAIEKLEKNKPKPEGTEKT